MYCEVLQCRNSKGKKLEASLTPRTLNRIRFFQVPTAKINDLDLQCEQKNKDFGIVCGLHFKANGRIISDKKTKTVVKSSQVEVKSEPVE